MKISTIFGSDLPLNEFRSSGQELIIKFKSHIINGSNRMNNTNAKFLFSYHTKYIGNLINICIYCFSISVVKANYLKISLIVSFFILSNTVTLLIINEVSNNH